MTRDRSDSLYGFVPGKSLPQQLYTDPLIFERDMDRLGRSLWIFVDHESRIPRTGDYFLHQWGTESLILVRDTTGMVNAYYNVCRHRGTRLLRDECGHASSLICPYHAWNYGLDGTLRKASSMPQGFDPKDIRLKRCHVRVAHGLLFVNFSIGDPPDFDQFIGRFLPLLAFHGFDRARVIDRQRYSLACNWKMIVENSFECYHCRPIHAGLAKVYGASQIAAYGGGPVVDSAYEAECASLLASDRDRGYSLPSFQDGPDSPFFQTGGRSPIGRGSLTNSLDGKPVCTRLMGQCALDGGQSVCIFNPLIIVICSSDYAVALRVTPRSTETTDFEAIWMVDRDAVEGVDYERAAVRYLWDVTSQEDKSVAEWNQLGVLSHAYELGPLSIHEVWLADFDRWYIQRIVTPSPGP
jgi:phenylpropionate dioxygenase-like ring-hydroxylating dioxygenase large terminal subunit